MITKGNPEAIEFRRPPSQQTLETASDLEELGPSYGVLQQWHGRQSQPRRVYPGGVVVHGLGSLGSGTSQTIADLLGGLEPLSYWAGGSAPAPPKIDVQTIASMYLSLESRMSQLEERTDTALYRLASEVAGLSHQVASLHGPPLREDDTSDETAISTIDLQERLSTYQQSGADAPTWAELLSQAADQGAASEEIMALANAALTSPNALLRAAASRVLVIGGPESADAIRGALSKETNKLARATMESALRALAV